MACRGCGALELRDRDVLMLSGLDAKGPDILVGIIRRVLGVEIEVIAIEGASFAPVVLRRWAP